MALKPLNFFFVKTKGSPPYKEREGKEQNKLVVFDFLSKEI